MPTDTLDLPKIEEKPAEVTAAEPAKEEFKFPSLAKGAGVFYEDDKHEVWIGVPLEAASDPTVLMATIDGAKMSSLGYLIQYHQHLARKAALQVTPGGKRIQQGLKETFKGVAAKAKSFIL